MAFRKTFKKYAKGVAKRGIALAKKRYVKKGKPNIKNIYNDVMMLKHLVNVEKKRYDVTFTTQTVAQNAGAISGAYMLNITPSPNEGVTGGTRIGLSIKLVSCCIDLKFAQQANAVNDIKLRYFLICRPDSSVTYSGTQTRDQFLEPNPFSAVVDYWSNRDPEYFTNFRVIKTGVINLKQDQVTGGQSIVQKKIPLKLNHHLKFPNDNSSVSTKNNFWLIVTASAGDTGTTSGATMDYNARWYYTDN